MGVAEWEAAIAADNPVTWWKMGTVSGGAITAADTFARGNNAASLGTSSGGQAWTAHSGTWGTIGNQGYMSAGVGAANQTASIDTGQHDGVFEADIVYPTDPIPSLGVTFRQTDNTHYMLVELNYTSSGRLNLWSNVGGVFTQLAGISSMGWVAGQTYRIKVVMAGTFVRVYVDGVPITGSRTPTGLELGTRVGLWEFSTDAPTARFDNLTFETFDSYADFGTDSDEAKIIEPLTTGTSGWTGVDQAVTFPDPQQGGFLHGDAVAWGAPTEFTVECIVRPTSIPVGHLLTLVTISRDEGIGGTGFVLVIDQSTGAARLQVNLAGSIAEASPPKALALGRWHHVAASFTDPGGASAKTLTVVVDGCFVVTATTTSALRWDADADNVQVGRLVKENGDTPNRFFLGDFSEAVLWRSALTVDQIKAHAHAAGFRCHGWSIGAVRMD